MLYRVNTTEFKNYLEAVAYARSINGEVYEIANGLRRWHPAPAVSSAKMRRYQERMAAWEAQQKQNAMKKA